MKSTLCVIIFALALSVCQAQIEKFGIVDQPKSQNKSKNDEATFSCSAPGTDTFKWSLRDINNKSKNIKHIKELNDQTDIEVTYGVNVNLSTLTIWLFKSIEKLNQSHLHCIAIKANQSDAHSVEAELLVQGIVAPPADIQTQEVCEVRQVYLQTSWNPPYVLDGVNIDEYMVTFGNDSISSGNVSSIAITVSENYYQLCLEDLEICVAAVTLAGESNSTCSAVNLTGGPENVSTADIQSEVGFSVLEETFNISFTISGDAGCWIPGTSSNISVIITNGSLTRSIKNIPYTFDEKTGNIIFTVQALEYQETTVSTYVITTTCDIDHCSDSVNNSLFHVYELTLDKDTVRCYFINGSTASGCQIHLTCSNFSSDTKNDVQFVYSEKCSFSIEKQTISMASKKLPNHCEHNCDLLVLKAYDILNGSPEPIPAKTISIIQPKPKPSQQSVVTSVLPSPSTNTTKGHKPKWEVIVFPLLFGVVFVVIIILGVTAFKQIKKRNERCLPWN